MTLTAWALTTGEAGMRTGADDIGAEELDEAADDEADADGDDPDRDDAEAPEAACAPPPFCSIIRIASSGVGRSAT